MKPKISLIAKTSRTLNLIILIASLIYITITFTSIFYTFAKDKISLEGQQQIERSKKINTKNKLKEPTHELSDYSLIQTLNETYQLLQNPNFISYKQQSKNLSKFYDINLPNRTYLGQPKGLTHQVMLWVISNHQTSIPSNIDTNICFLLNSLNIITEKTIAGLNAILNSTSFYKIILVTDANDVKGTKAVFQKIGKDIKQVLNIQIDSDYKFINNFIQGCERIAYGFGTFVFDQFMIENIKQQATNLQPLNLLYTSTCLYKNKNKKLKNLLESNLLSLNPQQFYEFLYIFDSKILEIVTPLNFAYYSLYNFEQILLFPILAIFQQSSRMRSTQKLLHGLYLQFGQFKQSIIKAPLEQKNSFCFVSYPNDPYQPIRADVIDYLSAVSQINKQGYNISLILSIPYTFNSSQSLFLIANDLLKFKQRNKNIRIRLRIRANKTVSSLAVYQATYSYCPSKSLIISTRHNIKKFNSSFLQLLSYALTQKFHYYFVNVRDENKMITSFQKMPEPGQYRAIRTSHIFEQKMKHIQIFKSDLMKSNSFGMLKSEQIEFYQTQSCFVTQMMESIRLKFHYINQTMVQIKTRNSTNLQKSQINNVKKYAQFWMLPNLILVPYRYDSLENPVHRRFALQKMERNIHQIWIGNDKISTVRWKLQKTIKQKNPNFQIYLWTNQNITQQIVPYTYKFYKRIFQYNKYSKTSKYAMAADLLRYELCLRFGGLYIDFKFQGLKPLDNFLKYEIIFLSFEMSSSRLGNPLAMGVGVTGSTKNNYHMNYLLTEIINQYTLKVSSYQIIHVTGGFVLRKSFNQQELLTLIGLGYHLLVPLPFSTILNECGSFTNHFEADQEIVQITDSESNRTVYYGVPCRAYPQAYLVIYNILAGTWVRSKSFVN